MDIFNDVIDRVADDLDDNDRIRAVINHPALDRPINLPMMRRADLDAECIISEIERVIQSNQGFRVDAEFTMDIIKVHLPRGEGFLNRNLPLSKVLKNKKSVVTIKNRDNLCMARALVVARAKQMNHPNCEEDNDGGDDDTIEIDKHEGREEGESRTKRVIYYFDTEDRNEGEHLQLHLCEKTRCR